MSFESRFGHCAEEFQRYRPDYPPSLYARLFAEINEEFRNCALDLGAGTGIVTGHLVSQFRGVVAVEPDEAMAAKIREQFPRVMIRQTTAEQYTQAAETVDLITIANALHWMDAAYIFLKAREWLRLTGVLAVFDRPLPKASSEIDGITAAEFQGPWKPYRDPRLKRDLDWKEQVRATPGFRVVEEAKFPNIIRMSPKEYVGFWRSTSYGSAYARTIAEPEQYWNALEGRFADASTGSVISADFSSTLILLRRSQ